MSKASKFLKGFAEFITYFGEVALISFERSSFEHKMLKIGGHNPDEIYKGFRNLESRKMLKRNKTGYAFTTKGKDWLERCRVDNLQIKKHKWDNKWRVVIFDIPESLRGKRAVLRSKLKTMGFYMIQRSAFAIPYRCDKEIADLCNYWEIDEYVTLLDCDSVGNRGAELKKFFNL